MSLASDGQGLFTVQYQADADLGPARQWALQQALADASAAGPVGVVFVIGPAVKFVDPAVPAYWLRLATAPGMDLVAVAVVSPNPGVAIATRNFSVTNTLKDTHLQVKPFQDEAEAHAWAAGVLAAAR